MPQLRSAARPITLRHLLTHTAGLGYFFIHPEVLQYFAAVGMPKPGSRASVTMPLMFDPGDRWEYSVATDWVGLAIEAATGERLNDYLTANLFAPLGMASTAFRPALPEDAARVHVRSDKGALSRVDVYLGGGEFDGGGGGITSTAPDYARFVRMMLNLGALDGQRVLSAASVAEMSRDQVHPLRAGRMGTAMPQLAQPYDTFPDQHTGWGLGFLINPEQGPNGRSPGEHWYRGSCVQSGQRVGTTPAGITASPCRGAPRGCLTRTGVLPSSGSGDRPGLRARDRMCSPTGTRYCGRIGGVAATHASRWAGSANQRDRWPRTAPLCRRCWSMVMWLRCWLARLSALPLTWPIICMTSCTVTPDGAWAAA